MIKSILEQLKNELSDLYVEAYNWIRKRKNLTIVSFILLYIIICFIWKPLFPLTIVCCVSLIFTIIIMLFPTICAFLIFFLPYIENEGKKEKYPILKLLVVFLLALTVFIFGTYFMYDVALKEIWITAPWKHILNLN